MMRQGRKVGRTLYIQVGPEPSDEDLLIGIVDTVEYAEAIVRAVNRYARYVDEDARWLPLGELG